jgi:hypothetical protein
LKRHAKYLEVGETATFDGSGKLGVDAWLKRQYVQAIKRGWIIERVGADGVRRLKDAEYGAASMSVTLAAVKYGLTLEEAMHMYRVHNGCCHVCQKAKPLHIDHCHETGYVRGMLCVACNTSIGKLGDCAEGVKRALRYLQMAESGLRP